MTVVIKKQFMNDLQVILDNYKYPKNYSKIVNEKLKKYSNYHLAFQLFLFQSPKIRFRCAAKKT